MQGDLTAQTPHNVSHLTSDSRRCESLGTVFFARRGANLDGHQYLEGLQPRPEILAFVVEKIPDSFKPKAPVIVVRDSVAAMALAAKSFYGDPTSQGVCCAVTGTNGKTTSTFLLQALLRSMGKRVVRTGTIETEFEGEKIPSELTTPDFSELQRIFSDFQKRGANAFVFEASSHALDQRRLLGVELDAAVFTNLTPEHLDYHRTMEVYFEAKKRLFSELLYESSKPKKFAVLSLENSYGLRLFEDLSIFRNIEIWTWASHPAPGSHKNHLHLLEWKTALSGSTFKVSGCGLDQQIFSTSLVGQHNVENVLGMVVLALAWGQSAEKIQTVLKGVPPVPGRLDCIQHASKAYVFVDYAHTPDALEHVLMTLRPLTKGKLRVVFGCGGDRDKTKRPKMGAIAELYADEIFVTSDNPRTEDPNAILEDILKGMQRLKPVHVEVDRRKAIGLSLSGLTSEDVVLIAGKGHENYQILGTEKTHFDDKEVVRSF